MSDRTWGLTRSPPSLLPHGRDAQFAALILMPKSSALWMAAGLLWMLDASINVSMEPFRAFVADLLPEQQRTRGFAMQSLFIGLGAVVASVLPWLLRNVFHVTAAVGETGLYQLQPASPSTLARPRSSGLVLWTILTTKEYPPDDLDAFRQMKKEKTGLASNAKEIVTAIRAMPQTMRQLAPVQLLTWLGLFCMWLYFPVAVARNVFGAPDTSSPLYAERSRMGWDLFRQCILLSVLRFRSSSPWIAQQTGSKKHAQLYVFWLRRTRTFIFLVAIYSRQIHSSSDHGRGCRHRMGQHAFDALRRSGRIPPIPGKTGVYMGIFNFFIVIPEILASLVLRMGHEPSCSVNNRIAAVVAGGFFMAIAAALMQRVVDGTDAVAVKVPKPAELQAAGAE